MVVIDVMVTFLGAVRLCSDSAANESTGRALRWRHHRSEDLHRWRDIGDCARHR